MAMPKVLVKDEGIRPAGPPDGCFYCKQKVGEPHGEKCEAVHKRVRFRIRAIAVFEGEWEEEVPFHWDAAMCEFARNEASWCQDNLDPKSVMWSSYGAGMSAIAAAGDYKRRKGCLCGFYTFTLDRVTEPGPYVRAHEEVST